ncbi:hypothetical protein Scep_017338 [Stephania cephalantha]|uniref:Myb/SANT-like domain-containing protein n=1 Tax=Stephania cephalantha TaxID=152367 RepID=A0AAP0NVK6_9MAGN
MQAFEIAISQHGFLPRMGASDAYRAISHMLNTSGFGWDDRISCVVDEDIIFDDYDKVKLLHNFFYQIEITFVTQLSFELNLILKLLFFIF